MEPNATNQTLPTKRYLNDGTKRYLDDGTKRYLDDGTKRYLDDGTKYSKIAISFWPLVILAYSLVKVILKSDKLDMCYALQSILVGNLHEIDDYK